MRFNTLVVLFAAVILFTVGNAQVVTSIISVISGVPGHVSSAVHRSSSHPVSSMVSSATSSAATTSSTTSSGTTTSSSGTSSSTGTPASSAAATTDVSQTVMLQLAGLLTIFAVSFGMMLA
ncbi:unnamed protein product [Umbelopsis ramanniana]